MGTVNGATGLLIPKLEPVGAADVVAGAPRANLGVIAISVLFWNKPDGRFISEKSGSKVLKELMWKLKVQMSSSKTEPLVGPWPEPSAWVPAQLYLQDCSLGKAVALDSSVPAVAVVFGT